MNRDLGLLKVIVLVSFLMLLNGCFSGGSTSSDSYMSGTEGLTMQFVESNPPSVIYVDNAYTEETPIEIEAFNRGTMPATPIETFFTGYDESLVSITDLSVFDFSAEDMHRTRYNPEGGYDVKSSSIVVQELGNTDVYDFNLKMIYCYSYETKVAVQICVDPNPNRVNKDDACTPASVSTNGQGAPIGISGIEIESMPGNVRLKMTVRHYGQGLVLEGDAQCRGVPQRSDENYVAFEIPRLGGITGTCATESPVKLRNGEANIICNFALDPERSSYSTILEMELNNYKIKDSIEKNIKIVSDRTVE